MSLLLLEHYAKKSLKYLDKIIQVKTLFAEQREESYIFLKMTLMFEFLKRNIILYLFLNQNESFWKVVKKGDLQNGATDPFVLMGTM